MLGILVIFNPMYRAYLHKSKCRLRGVGVEGWHSTAYYVGLTVILSLGEQSKLLHSTKNNVVLLTESISLSGGQKIKQI
jgi:hypothetical protein